MNVEPSVDERFREVNLGEWQGLTLEEVQTWDAQRYDALRQSPVAMPRPGGESWTQVARRAVAALEDLIAIHRGRHIVIVTHGGTIRALMMSLDLAKDGVPVMGNTARTVLVATHGSTPPHQWAILDFDIIAHLHDIGKD